MIDHLAHRPILVKIGLLMTAIVVLAVISMLSSVFIAETTDGMATAINQSGSLRMQSYRIGVALADERVPPPRRAERTAALVDEFEGRLHSPRLVNAIPGRPADEVTRSYAHVLDLWEHRMEPPLQGHIRLLASEPPGAQAAPRAAYLGEVDGFVAGIDALVRQLEEVAERRIDILKSVQATALLLTVAIVLVAMALVVRRVIRPLGKLLACADRVRQGDFSGRTRFAGTDELGRLGAAVNLMSESLSRLYDALEQRVAEKTRDLARTNHSLELLYRTAKTLNEGPVSDRSLRRLLQDIQDRIKTGPATLCLLPGDEDERGTLVLSARDQAGASCPCWEQGCRACLSPEGEHPFTLESPDGARIQAISFPVRDREERFGVLLVDLPAGQDLAPWQQHLLAALAGHIGTALSLQQRMRESRRLILYEERSILARELHDSLAQSLSYLKIQVTRLAAALDDQADPAKPREILEELREGISSAYRQLRELLTTFRLKMDDRGLGRALEETVQEMRARSSVDIRLDSRLPPNLLSPNEEIHVLQIVREALSNVIRHANARRADVRLRLDDGAVEVEVRDDGRGYAPPTDHARHYGLTIMRERTLSLDGELAVVSPTGGGTQMRLRFRHRSGGTTADAAETPLLGAT